MESGLFFMRTSKSKFKFKSINGLKMPTKQRTTTFYMKTEVLNNYVSRTGLCLFIINNCTKLHWLL